VKEALRSVTLEALRETAASCLDLETAEEIETRLRERLAPALKPVAR